MGRSAAITLHMPLDEVHLVLVVHRRNSIVLAQEDTRLAILYFTDFPIQGVIVGGGEHRMSVSVDVASEDVASTQC